MMLAAMPKTQSSARHGGTFETSPFRGSGEVSIAPLQPQSAANSPILETGTAVAISYLTLGMAALLPCSTGRGGARNRATRESHGLNLAHVANLTAAAIHADAIGRPFTRMVTIHWEAAGLPLAGMAKATGRYTDLMTKALSRHGSGTAWLWTHENGDGKGGHCHLVAHVPADLVSMVTRLQRGWLRRIAGKPYRARVIHSKPIGGRLGLETGNPDLHAINLEAALAYVLKGASPEAASQFALDQLEPGGDGDRQTLRHLSKHWRQGAQGKGLTMTKKAKANPGDGLVAPGETGTLEVEKRADEKVGRTLARIVLDPQTRNANLAMSFGSQVFGVEHRPDTMESSAVMAEEIVKAGKGDLSLASRIYTSQALSLDALFTEMARRSGNNMGQYPDAADRYMRLALKTQSACRSTLEALAKLHQPREQTVKHVHVNEGGQAVVADHFHQHTGGRENGKSAKQSDATGAAGTSAALLGPDPLGGHVPIPNGSREATMSNARGQ